jgi:eukaryotic-like serine/threonine-protein kinase
VSVLEPPGLRKRRLVVPIAATSLAMVLAAAMYFQSRSTERLQERDTVVVSDFENKTGDAVFDDTLKEAIAIDLEQSPFLNILSDQKIKDTLKLMNQNIGEPVRPAIAREICRRTGSKAFLTSSISNLGEPRRHCSEGGEL